MSRRPCMAVLFALAATAGAAAGCGAGEAPEDVLVAMTARAHFEPATVVVRRGDTVAWINRATRSTP